MLEKGRFAVLNKVTFEQNPGGAEGVRSDVWGRAVQTEGTASTEAVDCTHLHNYFAPCFYILFILQPFKKYHSLS